MPTKMQKVLSPTGSRRVGKIVSSERGKNATVVCSCNAGGDFVPPFFMFPRQRMLPELLNGCPPESAAVARKSGWMTTDVFVIYLERFLKYVKCSLGAKVLLLLDNHASHISLEAITFCSSHGVVMLGFPPHTTHRLQPLDVAFLGPLKRYYNQQCDNWVVSHPGSAITDRKIGQLLDEAYKKAATTGNAVNGFAACGIEPFNDDVFDESDFAPAKTTERDLPAISDTVTGNNAQDNHARGDVIAPGSVDDDDDVTATLVEVTAYIHAQPRQHTPEPPSVAETSGTPRRQPSITNGCNNECAVAVGHTTHSICSETAIKKENVPYVIYHPHQLADEGCPGDQRTRETDVRGSETTKTEAR